MLVLLGVWIDLPICPTPAVGGMYMYRADHGSKCSSPNPAHRAPPTPGSPAGLFCLNGRHLPAGTRPTTLWEVCMSLSWREWRRAFWRAARTTHSTALYAAPRTQMLVLPKKPTRNLGRESGDFMRAYARNMNLGCVSRRLTVGCQMHVILNCRAVRPQFTARAQQMAEHAALTTSGATNNHGPGHHTKRGEDLGLKESRLALKDGGESWLSRLSRPKRVPT